VRVFGGQGGGGDFLGKGWEFRELVGTKRRGGNGGGN